MVPTWVMYSDIIILFHVEISFKFAPLSSAHEACIVISIMVRNSSKFHSVESPMDLNSLVCALLRMFLNLEIAVLGKRH